MKTYKVKGSVVVAFEVEVEADSPEEAIEIGENMELFQAMNGYYRCDADLWQEYITNVEVEEV